MPLAVGVEVRRTKEIVWCDAGAMTVPVGERILIETEYGIEAGVVKEPEQMTQENPAGKKAPQGVVAPPQRLGQVLRRLTPEDLRAVQENAALAHGLLPAMQSKIRDSELPLKLIETDFTFDRQKLFVFYAAEERVDFRELIKELSHAAKVRVQMIQVGARDAAKRVGGIGPCGKVLCCGQFLTSFRSIAMEMAREQGLSPNPAKLTGMCGKLKCCLFYEYEAYRDARKGMPEIGSEVGTPDGSGRVKDQIVVEASVLVELEGGRSVKCRLAELTPPTAGTRQSRVGQPRPQGPSIIPEPEGPQTSGQGPRVPHRSRDSRRNRGSGRGSGGGPAPLRGSEGPRSQGGGDPRPKCDLAGNGCPGCACPARGKEI